MRKRWLIERRDRGAAPLWWAGQDAWVSDAALVPEVHRYQTMYEAHLSVMNEVEHGKPFGFVAWLIEHEFEHNSAPEKAK